MGHIGAAYPPSRMTPPRSTVPVSTKGLFPRDYRRRLQETDEPWQEVTEFNSTTVSFRGRSPIIGTALHYHHDIRPDIAPKLQLGTAARHYEEDPFTHRFLGKIMHCLTPNQSRYEFDLNRPPDTTIYSSPALAWGQQVWGEPLNQYEREFCLEKWYEFHTMMDCAVEDAITNFGQAIVLDFHSYNYQRKGATDWRTDDKPVINLGTRHLNLDDAGRKIVDDFAEDLKQHTVLGEECMVQENGVFYGGYLNRRLSHLFGPRVITLSVEYKKVYMDETTGEVHDDILDDLASQIDDTIGRLGERVGAATMDKALVPVPDPDLSQ
jgi:N-formylglutamate deformylase